MNIFSSSDFSAHEQVVFCNDDKSGLKAIIAIHNTNRGPALGGCRFWNYANDQAALKDVLRLSRGMTYKAALANLQLGGGKAVIIGDVKRDKTPELMKTFGRFVERLNGLYITAEDVNTTPDDMGYIHTETSHVVGLAAAKGGSGDPSEITAYGVYQGIRASVKYRFKSDSLQGVHVAIQGLGHVGMNLAKLLHQDGAKLTVTDINQDAIKKAQSEFNAVAVNIDEIYGVAADIFAPCALGGIINDETIGRLKCSIIAGAANNQLAEARHDNVLKDKGILYAPDYLINAGGLINVTFEGANYQREPVMKLVDGIYDTLLEILEMAADKNIATQAASDQVAEQRFMQTSEQQASRLRVIGNR